MLQDPGIQGEWMIQTVRGLGFGETGTGTRRRNSSVIVYSFVNPMIQSSVLGQDCHEVGFMHLIPGEVHNLSKAIGG